MARSPGGPASRFWLGGVTAIAVLQIILGLAGVAAGLAGVERPRLASEIPDLFRLIAVLSFGSLASYLLLGSRRDPRVSRLGTLFLVMGVFYAGPAIESLALALPDLGARAVRILAAVRVDAFTPALTWLFFRDFPRALEWPRTARVVSGIVRVCVLAALVLIAINLAIALGADGALLKRFDRSDPASQYWTVVFGLALPAPMFLVWRVRHAPADERRRVRLFTTGAAIGAVLPILLALVPALSKTVEDWARQGQAGLRIAQALMLASIVWIAANTTYAVAVNRVLEIGTVLRKAAQYAAVQVVTGTLVALPFAALVVFLYQLRREPISGLVEGFRPALMVGLVASGLGLMRIRRSAMAGIDRMFFRENYDVRRILADIAERSRATPSIGALASSLTAEIDRALHLETVALLVRDPAREAFVPLTGATRVLPLTSPLVDAISQTDTPLLVDLDRRSSPLHALPEDDRQWLADGASEVLVPLAGTDGSPIGLLSLGAKRSELPFSKDDLLLLSAIGGAAGIGLENRLLHSSGGRRIGSVTDELAAAECSRCGWLGTPGRDACPGCSGRLGSAHVPHELFGKFRLENRIGAGAMGVVYRATDLTLGRSVALKTLPVTSPEDSVRLRREARAMAAITHPNLALIFGAETWHGTPVLVMEYLAGGTLADRLVKGPLATRSALQLSSTLANVLDRVHAAGILHRDVKPSNIGFTEQHVPKLLDFGLVRIVGEPSSPSGLQPWPHAASESGIGGTPLYMSPEALLGAPPDPTFDLWSLGVVAFEALTGRHPFERSNPAQTLEAMRRVEALELRQLLPEVPNAVTDLFARLLARDPGRRPSTARRLVQLLEETEQALSLGSDRP